MQVYGNVATFPEQYTSKSTGRIYWQFRIAESQKGPSGASDATFYTVRVMKPEDPALSKGDFVKVTGSLKTDYYLSREGKPTGTLLIIAFDATKIAKPSALKDGGKQAEPAASKEQAPAPTTAPAPAMKQEVPSKAPDRPKAEPKAKQPTPVQATELEIERAPQRPLEPVRVTIEQEEADWSTLYT